MTALCHHQIPLEIHIQFHAFGEGTFGGEGGLDGGAGEMIGNVARELGEVRGMEAAVNPACIAMSEANKNFHTAIALGTRVA